MKNQTNQRLQSLLLAIIATVILLSVFTTAFGQDKIKYNAVYDCGEGKLKIKVLSCDGQSGDAECRVLFINEYSPGGGSVLKQQRSYVQENFTGKCAVQGGNANQDAQADINKTGSQTPEANTDNNSTPNNGQFEVGDRVKVSISGLKDEKYYQPCTITGALKDNGYNVKCDPWNTLPYMDYNVQPGWIRPWAGATAAPTFECSFDTPVGTVSKTAAPSAQLFKRVIYERRAALEKAKFGWQFTIFQMGAPYRNFIDHGHMHLIDAPLNGMIYPVKTQYKTCTEGTGNDTYNYLVVTKENYACFKDRFGDWVCGADSTPEFLEKQNVPKE